MTRVVLVLHERLGRWARQLRPRLTDPAIRWFETRSRSDLEMALAAGVGSPIILMDLERQGESGLDDLMEVARWSPDARIVVIDSCAREGTDLTARELGATHVFAGFPPPPIVAGLLLSWVALASEELEKSGWSRSEFPETGADAWSWLADFMGERYLPEAGVADKRFVRRVAALGEERELDSDGPNLRQ